MSDKFPEMPEFLRRSRETEGTKDAPPPVDEEGYGMAVARPAAVRLPSKRDKTKLKELGWDDAAIAEMDRQTAEYTIHRELRP